MRRGNAPYLLTQEIPNLKLMTIVLDDAIDREVGIYRTHFIQETLLEAMSLYKVYNTQ